MAGHWSDEKRYHLRHRGAQIAELDVSGILADPLFVDKVTLITRVSRVNSMGENVVTEQCLDSYGSVQPVSGKTFQRLPDALRVANVSSFWFKGEIIPFGKYPSILVFRGRRYQVQQVFEWATWGGGWTEGVCVAEVPA